MMVNYLQTLGIAILTLLAIGICLLLIGIIIEIIKGIFGGNKNVRKNNRK